MLSQEQDSINKCHSLIKTLVRLGMDKRVVFSRFDENSLAIPGSQKGVGKLLHNWYMNMSDYSSKRDKSD